MERPSLPKQFISTLLCAELTSNLWFPSFNQLFRPSLCEYARVFFDVQLKQRRLFRCSSTAEGATARRQIITAIKTPQRAQWFVNDNKCRLKTLFTHAK